jgi:exopolysaccharide biosynthesis polyprenyl glycosylphosphotransferase
VLLHRLPLDVSPLISAFPDDADYEVEPVRRLDLQSFAWLLRSADLALVVALPLLVTWHPGAPAWPAPMAAAGAAIVLWLAFSRAVRLYWPATLQAGVSHVLRAVAVLCAATAGGLVAARLASGGAVWPEALVPLQSVVVGALLTRLVWELALWAAMRRGACLCRVILMAESAAAARFLSASLERRAAGRLRVVACTPLPGMPGGPAETWAQAAIGRAEADRVLLAAGGSTRDHCEAVLNRFRRTGLAVTLLPDSAARHDAGADRALLDPVLYGLHAGGAPLSDTQAAIKRAVDIVIAVSALLFLSPALLAIALAIKLDSKGPVFFLQQREGLNGSRFLMWKFRSMYTGRQDEAGSQQTSRNDDRVTRVGRLIRRSSIDELPQLINVLLGDMSIVGPRPHPLGMTVAGQPLDSVARGYAERHRVKPGITGWAQINGCRGEVNEVRKLRRRIALDCYYIENWSLGIDALIILRTAALLVADRHAY